MDMSVCRFVTLFSCPGIDRGWIKRMLGLASADLETLLDALGGAIVEDRSGCLRHRKSVSADACYARLGGAHLDLSEALDRQRAHRAWALYESTTSGGE